MIISLVAVSGLQGMESDNGKDSSLILALKFKLSQTMIVSSDSRNVINFCSAQSNTAMWVGARKAIETVMLSEKIKKVF